MSSKITLTGRPGTVQKQTTFVVFTMKSPPVPQNLPKGLPTIKGETKYMVLAALKQWNKVEEALNKDKEDRLYIEGYGTVQEGFPGIVVQATMLNTLGLMRKRKEEQRQQAQKK